MEMEGIRDEIKKYKDDDEEEEEEIIDLPGFRFNPTDEELVGFYLLRKVEGKSISIELIKQVDIYKYDPWDLPKMGSSSNSSVRDKEWYYFCMRGRKYRNSSRPNRVTAKGSGFWKATGIDKSIYSSNYMKCIGLKKSLVYYCGSAGKGTKTDWMMHEFRLPPNYSNISNNTNTIHQQSASAEVWTLCRIFKRNASSCRKYATNSKQITNDKTGLKESNSRTCSLESAESSAKYIAVFKEKDLENNLQEESHYENNLQERSHYEMAQEISVAQSLFTSSSSNLWNPNGDSKFFRNGNWDELGSVVELALDRSL